MTREDDDVRTTLADHRWTYQPSVTSGDIRRLGTQQSRRARLIRSVAVGGAGIVVAGAVWLGPWWSDPSEQSAYSADDGPMLTHAQTPSNMLMALGTGRPLELRSGCLLFANQVIVWPADAQWNETDKAVELTVDQSRVSVYVGKNLPPGLGGGLMPIHYAARFLDSATQDKVQACLDQVHQTDVLFVN